MEKAGIDVEPEIWFLKVWLRFQTEAEVFPISGIEQKRLWSLLQEDTSLGFAVFDSQGERIAINPNYLLAWHLLWESPLGQRDPSVEEYAGLTVLLSDRQDALEFEIDYDTEVLGPENAGRGTQFQQLFVDVELGGMDSGAVLSFEDTDGEEVFLRASDVKPWNRSSRMPKSQIRRRKKN
jgi:hypothetical protein